MMIGGWESFHGLLGFYHMSPLADVLPVLCRDTDDRNNEYQGFVPEVIKDHPIVSGLPFNKPPVLCGYNSVTVKDGSEEILSLRKIRIADGTASIDSSTEPLLVLGTYGKGKTGAFMSDFAPHWVGGFVDWGDERINSQAPNASAVEVGDLYVKFIGNFISYFTS